jgi:hypothetical protein
LHEDIGSDVVQWVMLVLICEYVASDPVFMQSSLMEVSYGLCCRVTGRIWRSWIGMNNRCCDLVAAAFQQYALKPKAKILLVFTGLNVYYCMLD